MSKRAQSCWRGSGKRTGLLWGAVPADSLSCGNPGTNVITLSIATPANFDHVHEYKPGHYRSSDVPGRLQYEFKPTTAHRFLVLPGLKTDQELEIYFRDVQERWRSARFVLWLPPPRSGEQPVVDLERMIHLWGEPVRQIAVQLTRPGEIALEGPPRLMARTRHRSRAAALPNAHEGSRSELAST